MEGDAASVSSFDLSSSSPAPSTSAGLTDEPTMRVKRRRRDSVKDDGEKDAEEGAAVDKVFNSLASLVKLFKDKKRRARTLGEVSRLVFEDYTKDCGESDDSC